MVAAAGGVCALRVVETSGAATNAAAMVLVNCRRDVCADAPADSMCSRFFIFDLIRRVEIVVRVKSYITNTIACKHFHHLGIRDTHRLIA